MIAQRMDVLLPLLAALVAGSFIGLERGLRSEPAGFRTHALVCAGAAAIVVGAVHAGQILREGLTVRGLTTAASVWAMAGLGVVFGYGLYLEGFAGTAVLLVILMGL